MHKYGLIVHPVLDEEEADASQGSLWKHMGPKVTSDHKTWETSNWPQPDTPFLSTDFAIDEQAFYNRVHTNLVCAFTQFFGTDNLLATIDFYGVKRATLFPEGERKDWRTKALQLHWDLDITNYVTQPYKRYQALIALNDNAFDNGSFACVPGSHAMLAQWLTQYTPENTKYVPAGNLFQKNLERIPLKKGHAVIWDMGLAHANFENISTEPRLTQYVRMIPRSVWFIKQEKQCILHFWNANPHIKAALEKNKRFSCAQRLWLGLK